jgi:hypothetical protein
MSDNSLLAIVAVAMVCWLAFIWGGTAYLVGWCDWSPWWFVLTIALSSASNVKVQV